MQTRKLGKKVHFLIPQLYQSFASTLIAPIPMILMLMGTGVSTKYTWFEVVMLFAVSVCSLIAQIFQTKSLQIEKAGRVAPV